MRFKSIRHESVQTNTDQHIEYTQNGFNVDFAVIISLLENAVMQAMLKSKQYDEMD